MFGGYPFPSSRFASTMNMVRFTTNLCALYHFRVTFTPIITKPSMKHSDTVVLLRIIIPSVLQTSEMLQLTIHLLLLLSIPMDLAPKDVQGLTEIVWVQPNLEESLKCLLLGDGDTAGSFASRPLSTIDKEGRFAIKPLSNTTGQFWLYTTGQFWL